MTDRPALPPRPGRPLFDGPAIAVAVERLADQLGRHFGDSEVTALIVLDGALVFAADLIRHLTLPLRLETVSARSYRGAATEPGALSLPHLPADVTVAGRHVLVIEDIVDTGATLARLLAVLNEARAASITVVTLLDKPDRRVEDVRPDFVGFTIPDLFVVGYGLDHDGRWRNLPSIHALSSGSDRGPSADAAGASG